MKTKHKRKARRIGEVKPSMQVRSGSGVTHGFVGTWIPVELRAELKSKCALLGVNQQDIIAGLVLGWLQKPHIKKVGKD